MTRFTVFALLLLTLWVISSTAYGRTSLEGDFIETLEEGGALSLEADSFHYNESRGVYEASGSVHIEFRHFVIDANNFEINSKENRASTDDYFKLHIGELVFTGASFSYDYDKELGSMKDVKASMEGTNFAASEMEIRPDGSMLMRDVIATTCCMENKEYYVEARSVGIQPDGKAKFHKLSFYLKGHKILKWPSYSTMLFGTGVRKSGMDVGAWSFSPPSLGYADYGGVELKADATRKMNRGRDLGFYMNYYANDGLFSEARLRQTLGDYDMTVRLGKQYKENTGYFRYFDPVQVWNLPTLHISKTAGRFQDTKLIVGTSLEIGRIKEAQLRKPLDRAFLNFDARYPLNNKGKIKYAVLGDGRYAIYTNFRKYRIWGSGLEAATGDPEDAFFRLQYMSFRYEGSTPLYSDLVDTNEKLFYYNVIKLSRRNRIMIDAQYDVENSEFDEIVYGFVRHWECLKFILSWRAEQRSIGLRMQIKVPGRNAN